VGIQCNTIKNVKKKKKRKKKGKKKQRKKKKTAPVVMERGWDKWEKNGQTHGRGRGKENKVDRTRPDVAGLFAICGCEHLKKKFISNGRSAARPRSLSPGPGMRMRKVSNSGNAKDGVLGGLEGPIEILFTRC